ncbi:mandelate racemase/muconate lactonizing enzyme family protein [Glaciimonas sp. PCH181]|uniref:mandelate racemase/muconate lactonizing enzyme family protein n=1 Tax=Glaciimonas sp. PCH181 TaxID=2133943 RepID=UPI000D345E7A|nr:mandelate racemase/muconate lactonizing enzyme family protein [Glaciimonas sp. PCH181]PUA18888.1 mandelate racemase [Glaciimonas sp. PCH181]
MAIIQRIEIVQVDLIPKTKRSDAIQSFVAQETVLVTLHCDDGSSGTGYTYTIGTGGSSIVALLKDHLAPRLIGCAPENYEHIWRDLLRHTNATAVGAITSLALAAIDTAIWDRNCRQAGLPLWKMAGGAQPRVPVYTTEGGWLHLEPSALVDLTLQAKDQGFLGAKIKVGKKHLAEDMARLSAVRNAVGDHFEIMVDANQSFTAAEAIRRAHAYSEVGIAWLEEPLPAQNINAHKQLVAHTSIPIAVGESMYDPGQFGEYLKQEACSIVQPDVARVGGITPWLKVAHLAETLGVAVCPHFLMELHVSLCAAVPSATWVEYIPQLDDLTDSRIRIEQGHALPPDEPGIGISWNWQRITAQQKFSTIIIK